MLPQKVGNCPPFSCYTVGMDRREEGLSDYVTASEAAAIKGVHRSSVHKAIQSGKLPAENVGGRYLIRRAALDEWTVWGHRPPGKETGG